MNKSENILLIAKSVLGPRYDHNRPISKQIDKFKVMAIRDRVMSELYGEVTSNMNSQLEISVNSLIDIVIRKECNNFVNTWEIPSIPIDLGNLDLAVDVDEPRKTISKEERMHIRDITQDMIMSGQMSRREAKELMSFIDY